MMLILVVNMKKLVGKKFKVKMPDEMLFKLNSGLNLHKEVVVRSDDDGYTIVFSVGVIDAISSE
jgi:hypothetical protein